MIRLNKYKPYLLLRLIDFFIILKIIKKMSICSKTSQKDFPHHWKCIQTDGHVGCTCSQSNDYCKAFECTLADGSRRFPDHSFSAKDHLEAGGMSLAIHSFGPSGRKIQVVNVPK